MKKTFLILGAVVIFMASFTKADLAKEKSAIATATMANSAFQSHPGEKLINKSDCLGCHNKTNKIIGPAYIEVAKKYPATEKNINMLADKIIKGGTGVWGNMPMTAHATLKKEDAKLMVKYILSLKK
ncbi:c-type cytochrome [Pedobacter sp. HDW13]|uniref:c-type cytochrome n=1 Tax=unclassified Pedobacter TaxID=2628915 RepID=UPI000F5913FD|nr:MULTISPECIES: c-type cytochrome [unclassified Pedobacter]QIL38543.1 c-type cytochrome [Pedobacter sp. HDW13]RQO77309.1 cytochrome C552 [Pedobacter sp. KBW01]